MHYVPLAPFFSSHSANTLYLLRLLIHRNTYPVRALQVNTTTPRRLTCRVKLSSHVVPHGTKTVRRGSKTVWVSGDSGHASVGALGSQGNRYTTVYDVLKTSRNAGDILQRTPAREICIYFCDRGQCEKVGCAVADVIDVIYLPGVLKGSMHAGFEYCSTTLRGPRRGPWMQTKYLISSSDIPACMLVRPRYERCTPVRSACITVP